MIQIVPADGEEHTSDAYQISNLPESTLPEDAGSCKGHWFVKTDHMEHPTVGTIHLLSRFSRTLAVHFYPSGEFEGLFICMTPGQADLLLTRLSEKAAREAQS